MAEKHSSFEWITNRSTHSYITIDVMQRLYISKSARKLMNLPHGQFRLIAGYDFANDRIVLAKPEIVRVPNVEPFNFDKRSYSRVKHFVAKARLADMLPLRFVYKGLDYADYPEGAYAFELEGAVPADK